MSIAISKQIGIYYFCKVMYNFPKINFQIKVTLFFKYQLIIKLFCPSKSFSRYNLHNEVKLCSCLNWYKISRMSSSVRCKEHSCTGSMGFIPWIIFIVLIKVVQISTEFVESKKDIDQMIYYLLYNVDLTEI